MLRATFHQLKTFETVARRASFARASEELSLSPSTISIQVKQLAEAVGLPLFEQTGKRIHITDAGKELHAASKQIFDAWARFEMTIEDMKVVKSGKLRLVAVTTAKYIVPRLLGRFCERYPTIDVNLEVADRDRVLERLRGNVDDLYIMALPPRDLDVAIQPFLDNPLVVVAPRAHPLAGKKKLALAQLAKERFILREKSSATRIASQRFFDEHRFAPIVRLELSSNEAIKGAVASGLGLSVLSIHALDSVPERGELTILDVKGFPIRDLMWSVVHSCGKQMSVVAQAFYDYLQVEAIALKVPLVVGRLAPCLR